MSTIQNEIDAYKRVQTELEAEHMGSWVLMHDGEVIDFFESFEVAAADAVERFGEGPFLIRQIGAESITLPASVMYRPHAF